MTYVACLPPVALQPYVDAFWETAWSGEHPRPQRILPDGCVDVVWNLGTPLPSGRGPGHDLPRGGLVLIGALTRPVDLAYRDGSLAFGIRFKPAGLARFIDTPLQHTQNATVDFTAFAPPLAQQLARGRFADAPTFAARCHAASGVLSARLPTPLPEPRLWHAVQHIVARAGQVRVGEAARVACLSERQFERRFTALVGLAPKQLAELVRFRAVCRQLKAAPAAALETVALETGYHDAAHLSRTFRRYAGNTPRGYGAG